MKFISVLTALATVAWAHDEPGAQSLPNLFKVLSLDEITKQGWIVNGDVRYDAGRLLVQNGGIWSSDYLANGDDEWVTELTFRSLGTNAKDHDRGSTNGMSLWLTSQKETDTLNFGGPQVYDGFQVLISGGTDVHGMALFNGDGHLAVPPVLENAIGQCKFNYLDSMVPFTVRIAYSKKTGILKMQVDNNLCFRTDKIAIPNGQKFKFGLTALLLSSEEYEILKFNTWDHWTQDTIDDHGLIEDGKLKIEFKTVEKPAPTQQPLAQVVNERTPVGTQAGTPSVEIDQLVGRIGGLEQRMDTLITHLSNQPANQGGKEGNYDGLAIQIGDFRTDIINYQRDMLEAIKVLNDKLAGEVRGHHQIVDALGQKVDLLMKNHKELSTQQPAAPVREVSDSDLVLTIFKWVLIPVVVLLGAILIVMFRLRRDIKHSKLL